MVQVKRLHHIINSAEPPLLKLSGILPFGANVNDLPGPPGDDSASKPITLWVQFPFFGRNYSKIIVRIIKI